MIKIKWLSLSHFICERIAIQWSRQANYDQARLGMTFSFRCPNSFIVRVSHLSIIPSFCCCCLLRKSAITLSGESLDFSGRLSIRDTVFQGVVFGASKSTFSKPFQQANFSFSSEQRRQIAGSFFSEAFNHFINSSCSIEMHFPQQRPKL